MPNGVDMEHLINIVLAGDISSGKTSFITRYVYGQFEIDWVCNAGIPYKFKTLDIDNTKIRLHIWDTTGEERYKSIGQSQYNYANGVIVVIDLTSKSSLNNVDKWISIAKSYDIQCILVGTKSDLKHMKCISIEEIETVCKKYHVKYFEVSSKTGENISKTVDTFCLDILKNTLPKSTDVIKCDTVKLNEADKTHSSCSIF